MSGIARACSRPTSGAPARRVPARAGHSPGPLRRRLTGGSEGEVLLAAGLDGCGYWWIRNNTVACPRSA